MLEKIKKGHGESPAVNATSLGRKVTVSAVMAGLTLSMGASVLAPDAMAAKGDYKGDPTFTGASTKSETDKNGDKENATMFGRYILGSGSPFAGKTFWCIDAGLDWPYDNGFAANATSSEKAPTLSYVMNVLDNGSKGKERMSRDMAASSIIHRDPNKELVHRNILDTRTLAEVDTESGGPGWDKSSTNISGTAGGWDNFTNEVLPNAKKFEKDVWADAKKYAGNGNFKATMKMTRDGESDKGTVEVSLQNSDGVAVPGFAGSIALKNATIDGKDTLNFTSEDKVKKYDVTFEDPGQKDLKATADVKFAKVPSSSVTVYTPKDFGENKKDRYDQQRGITKKTASAEANAAIDISGEGAPSVTTKTTVKEVKAGDTFEVADDFTVTGLKDGQKIKEITHDYYWSPTKPKESATAPKGAEKVGTVKSTNVGNGDHTTGKLKIENAKGGYFYWTESFPADGDQGFSEWKGKHGISEETTVSKYVPKIKTRANDTRITLDEDGKANLSDHYEMWDAKPNTEYTVNFNLNGGDVKPPKEGEATPEDVANLQTKPVKIKTDAEGKASGQTEDFTVEKEGVYWFTYTGTGGEEHVDFTDDKYYVEETSVVPWTPSIKTAISKQEITGLPDEVTDKGEITGARPGDTLTVSTDAWIQDGKAKQSPEAPKGAKKVDTFVQEVKISEDGTGSYETDPFKVENIECGATKSISFQVKIASNDTNEKWQDDYAVPEETATVTIPCGDKGENPPPPEKPSPDQPAPDKPGNSVKTGGEVQDGPNVGLIGGLIALLAGATGVTTWGIRRNKGQNKA